jgi:hypothetical protein
VIRCVHDALKGLCGYRVCDHYGRSLVKSAVPLQTRKSPVRHRRAASSQLAISLIQPWAWAVVHAGKSVENRVWWTAMRGEFWIAASATTTLRYYQEAKRIIEHVAGVQVPSRDDLDYGGIIGRARIADCILPGGYKVQSETHARNARSNALLGVYSTLAERHPLHPHPWHFVDQYGYVLEDVRAVPFVACKGHQRWWNVPADVLKQLQDPGVPGRRSA